MTTAALATGKLGKLPVRTDVRTLRLKRYVDAATLPTPPATLDLTLPLSARRQDVWDWTGSLSGDSKPGSWGGHAVDVVGFDASGLTVVTWGRLQAMTWSFWDRYCDESYAVLSRDFLSHGRAPNG